MAAGNIEEALATDPDRVLAVADAFGQRAFIFDRASGRLTTSRSFVDSIGHVSSVDEFAALIHDDDQRAFTEAFESCRDGACRSDGSTFRLRSRLGSEVDLHVAFVTIDAARTPTCLGTVTTADEATVRAIAERDADFHDVATNIPGAVFRYVLHADGADTIEYISDGCFDIWEMTSDEIESDPTPLWALIHPDDLADMQRSVSESARTLSPWKHEYRIIPRSGNVKWLAAYGQPRRLSNGDVLWHSMILDITRQHRTETALADSLRQTVEVLAATVEARDAYTAGHQSRVADLATAIGEELGLGPHRVEGLTLAASIHDIGKIKIPAEILGKPGTLTHVEFELIKTHSEAGAHIVRDIRFPWPVTDMILQHHERMDGSGYPRGLAGDDICLEARIIAVADTIEAIASHRPYRPSLGIDRAREEVTACAGTSLDRDMVNAAIAVLEAGHTL